MSSYKEKGCDPGGVWGHEESIHVQSGLGSGNQVNAFLQVQDPGCWPHGGHQRAVLTTNSSPGFCFQSQFPGSRMTSFGEVTGRFGHAREVLIWSGSPSSNSPRAEGCWRLAEGPRRAGTRNELGKRLVVGQLAL